MLHEALIVLAGHESPLITKAPSNAPVQQGLLHKSEQALLTQVAVLGQLHADVTRRIKWVQQLHHSKDSKDSKDSTGSVGWHRGPLPPSSHAVAASIDTLLVSPFGNTLVELEARILRDDSSYVGGDQIVSLSAIVAETVRKWERRFRYAESLLNFLVTQGPQPGFDVLARLDRDVVTGYTDIKQLVLGCIANVQKTWLQQLTCWVLYGRLPHYMSEDQNDFMIIRTQNGGFELVEDRIPPMCTHDTARDVFAIGSSMAQLKANGAKYYQGILKEIDLPISEAQLSKLMAQIRSLVYRDVVGTSMSLLDIRRFLHATKDFALLGSADFGIALLGSGGSNGSHTTPQPQEYFRQAVELFIEDQHQEGTESQGWSRMFQYLSVKDSRQQVHHDKFDDVLIGIRCKLVMTVEWPFSILISEVDKQRYAFVFAFLAALAKAHHQVSNLWRRAKRGQSLLAMKVKLFFDAFWDYAQGVVITPLFDSILMHELTKQESDGQINPQEIISKHSHFLTEVCRLLFLDNEDMRLALRQLIINCLVLAASGNNDHEMESSMRRVYQTMESLPDIDSKINLLLLKLDATVGE